MPWSTGRIDTYPVPPSLPPFNSACRLRQHARRAIGQREEPVHGIGPGQVQALFRNRLALMLEKARSPPRISSIRPTPDAVAMSSSHSQIE